ncbi:histidine phosphatase family protein [Priestia megaterium]|nr:histidine phosphatase family protein [Priestia megaterium]
MEISLIRHGRSLCVDDKRMSCTAFKKWVEKYDSSGVVTEHNYPKQTVAKINNANLVITSDLKRSIHSAQLLKEEMPLLSDSMFREVELPVIHVPARVKLKPNTWAVMVRCLWFSGYSNSCESFKEAKKRAEQAAQSLIAYAKEHQFVTVVGHGFFNIMIAKELQKAGWNADQKINGKHWNCSAYTLMK